MRARRLPQADKAAYRTELKRVARGEPPIYDSPSQRRADSRSGPLRFGQSNRKIGEDLFAGRTGILTLETFLKGLVHIGLSQLQRGRAVDSPRWALRDSLASIGFSRRGG